jgi:outer membrane receptor protein involved in Fe transport
VQFNLGCSRDVDGPWGKPLTLRFDVVNLFDHAYKLRDGAGIGVFGPRYGRRRGFFLGVWQAL